MSLKIVHIVYSFGVGGLERVIANLINSSSAQQATHHIVTLIDDHGFANQLREKVEFYNVDKKPGKDLLCHYRVFKLLRKIKPDVVHTYNFGTLEYQLVSWLARVPVRVHAEHGRESSYKKIGNPSRNELFRKLLIPFLSFFVVVSKDLKDWGSGQLGLTSKKLKLIFNGIPVSDFSGDNVNTNAEREFVFINVGRLVDVKNQILLIDAFSEALDRHPAFCSTKLKIVGDGPNHRALVARIFELELSHSIFLCGRRDDIPALLRQSKVFVLSSKYEAMPMTALEAMASGLPVIAPRVGGVEHILAHGENGLLVESNSVSSMADALIYAYEHQSEMKRMGETGFNMVESKFSVELMCRAYFSLYESASNKVALSELER